MGFPSYIKRTDGSVFTTFMHVDNIKSVAVSVTASGVVIPAVTGKTLKVFAVKLVCSAAVAINFNDGGASPLEGSQSFSANGGVVEFVTPPAFLFQTTVGNSLNIDIVGAGTVSGRISYWEE